MMPIQGSDFVANCLKEKRQFLGCMRPDSLETEWYLLEELTEENAEQAVQEDQEIFVVQPFDPTESTRYFHLNAMIEHVDLESARSLEDEVGAEYPISAKQRLAFTSMIRAVLPALKTKDLRKVVLSLRLPLSSSKGAALRVERLFTRQKKTSFRHIFSISEDEIWLGETPEPLLRRSVNRIQTVALAGTRRKSELKHSAFSEKEIEEQGVIVEELKQRIAPMVTQIQVSDRHEVSAGALVHLNTTLEGTLQDGVLEEDVLKALHPTAAVCGYPRERALAHIAELEPNQRGLYAGYLGLKSKDRSDYFVNLRCAQLSKSEFSLYVGAGITARSIPEDEADEIQSKTAAMMRLFSFDEVNVPPVN